MGTLDKDTNYNVYRLERGGECKKIQTKAIRDTSFEDCNVQAGYTYRYAVTIAKRSCESEPSNVVGAVIPQS